MNTTIYHIDTKSRLKPGLSLQAGPKPTAFGIKIGSAIKTAGLSLPQKGALEDLDHPALKRLPAILLREYLVECARHRVGNAYARWSVLYGSESLGTAQRIAQRLNLAPGISIYKAEVKGWVFPHDMSWLDHNLEALAYDKRVEWYCEYWRVEGDQNPVNLARRSQPSLTELLVQGQITIGEKVGETTAC
jgi:hypothetical protein